MEDKHILLGVSGGIAAFKAASLASLLVKEKYAVQVLMTEHALEFVTPLTFQALTKRPVIVSTFDEPSPDSIAHIHLADHAKLYVIAPATANVIAKLAHGLADDMVTTTALAVTCPLMVVPAMNVHMMNHPAVIDNLEILRSRGVLVVDPAEGPLACGYTGRGRLPEPEDIVSVIRAVLSREKDLQGCRILVTAGPTVEAIDPVRVITNPSSGKMGYALARAAVERGAEVTLVSGPVSLPPVEGTELIRIESTNDLLEAVSHRFSDTDVLIAAAAPSDFRPAERLSNKWKKQNGIPKIKFISNPDVLATMGQQKTNQILIGFAAETEGNPEEARRKLEQKRLDMLVHNNILLPGVGFQSDTNEVTLYHAHGQVETLPKASKNEIAQIILDRVAALWHARKEG
ncbi:bifunctional phosphopantothenoylcysteine decarboxylase/phosphopantothenate--cysteine ligase CoaBC [Alicyclobacillus sp. TC]|uniref:bifunctional phosphopantothenoylcysteine decarboxylase/phosphopantothenate--cysteine ligase CoaBC n=1 Tax=Alicyclobacillus sp. TC TaxID=2606450 RepID=UPI00193184CE|nr:bifunctional phosphopantothenoylcysteine decarboxylase/phosphopantothenate--cysteine ligase CoaBC [Alicyclobacillus sp. TC]QRF23782.1 bifunctional phosphopantothenoylcysteine decarboxylase/phosphopantothenate--cysteine ligase CoaBC [Alicyclobacillus sp. TC]